MTRFFQRNKTPPLQKRRQGKKEKARTHIVLVTAQPSQGRDWVMQGYGKTVFSRRRFLVDFCNRSPNEHDSTTEQCHKAVRTSCSQSFPKCVCVEIE